jgi:ABC-type phosphate/phosphonate transport system substrate-binding protein
MIASLPMYDVAGTMAANDRLWAAIRDGLRAAGLPAPDALTRGAETLWPQWTAPDLILSQTCGMPYRTRLHGHVTLIGTPDYGVEGCPPGYYRSVFVVRTHDPRTDLAAFDGAAMAYNEDTSQSGWSAPLTHAAQRGLRLRPALRTGGHRLSLIAVAEGRAEIAALDAVSWRLFSTAMAEARAVRVIAMTDPTPGLPLIAAAGADQPRLFRIITAAITAADRAATGLRGLVAIPADAYLAVPTPAAD